MRLVFCLALVLLSALSPHQSFLLGLLFLAEARGADLAALRPRVIEYWDARVARNNLAGDALAACKTEHRVMIHNHRSPPPVVGYELIEIEPWHHRLGAEPDKADARLMVVNPDGTRRYVQDTWSLDGRRGWLRHCDAD